MRLPHAILLNGSTSAGKSSIARELLARLPRPYLHVGIDTIFPWLPPAWSETAEGIRLEKQADGTIPVLVGPGGARLLRAWRRMIRTGIDEGMRFVIDEVLLDAGDLPDWRAALAGCDLFVVGVRCDLAELQRREIARGDRGVGQALWQHQRVHGYGPYDLEVDTTATPTAICAEAILAALGAA
jgi:chloramphenicol 3-O phosphotransferase